MEEMLKKTDTLKELYNFRDKEEIIEYICFNFYLTQSEIREIFQILEDISIAKDEKIMEILKKNDITEEKNLKKRGELFLENMRSIRYPLIYEANKKALERVKKIKNSNIKVSYPENFEGEGIKIEIILTSIKDVKKMLERLNSTEKEIGELIEIVKNGG